MPVESPVVLTPSHTTGPFFPAEFAPPEWRDLTHVPGAPGAVGNPMRLFGRVLDAVGDPAANVIVEIWQADGSGRYAHPLDPEYTWRDPGFRGWGRCATDSEGRYEFRTVKPGAHPSRSNAGWVRPPHVDVMLIGSGIMRPIRTQIFFPGEPLNDTDCQLESVPASRRERLVAVAVSDDRTPGAAYRFDIALGGDRATPFFEA